LTTRVLLTLLLAALGIAMLAAGAGAACHGSSAPASAVRAATPVVASGSAVATIDDRFLSVAVDSAQVVGAKFWAPLDAGVLTGQQPVPAYDFTRPKLRALAQALSPAYLRIGGTTADKVYYDMSDAPPAAAPDPYLYVMTRAQWDGVNDFASALGMRVLFTINAGPGPRDKNLAWTPDNAQVLLAYTASKRYDVALWELGNEVDAFPLAHGLSFVISPQQLAQDVVVAKTLVAATTPGVPLGAPSSAYWPVLGEAIPFYPAFMDAGGGPLDVVTWHYYPTQSHRCPIATRRADPSLMLDPSTLDEIDRWAADVEGAAQGKPVWLGETGNAQCGGEPGVSDAFAGGFWWLDELARVARRGERVVVRQTLSGSDYGLIDDATLAPRPDYWTSVLWRRLVGATVLDATGGDDPLLRVYAHCTRAGAPDQASGAVTLVVLNLDPATGVELNLDAMGGDSADVYALSSSDPSSTSVALNGTTLASGDDGSLPPLAPAAVTRAGGALRATLPPASYGFVVVPGAAAAACR
jgi:heparanase 1